MVCKMSIKDESVKKEVENQLELINDDKEESTNDNNKNVNRIMNKNQIK